MTPDPELPFPGNRILSGWWGQFAPLRPRAIGFAHLPLQTLELRVEVARPVPLDRLGRLLLEAAAIPPSPDAPAGSVRERLGLPAACLRHWLAPLHAAELLTPLDAGGALTAAGRAALEAGRYEQPLQMWQAWSFLQLGPASPPIHVPFTAPLRLPAWESALPAAARLRPAQVEPLILETSRAAQGGEPVRRVLGPREGAIALSRVERLSVLMLTVESPGGEARLQLYPTRCESWSLATLDPLVVLDPAEIPAPTPEAWRGAWQEWCEQRHLAPADREAIEVRLEAQQWHARLPADAGENLRRTFADWAGGEPWLTRGDGHVRHALPMRFEVA